VTILLREGVDGLAAVLGPSVSTEDGSELDVLRARMVEAARAHRPVTLDVSMLTLLPDEVDALLGLVGAAPGATVTLVCSRLTGRRLLRRVLPTSVLIVVDHPATGAAGREATVQLAPSPPRTPLGA
jgi:hypothetical protein